MEEVLIYQKNGLNIEENMDCGNPAVWPDKSNVTRTGYIFMGWYTEMERRKVSNRK